MAEAVLLGHGVGVDAGDLGAREEVGDGLLHLLGAVTLPADLGGTALGADHRGALLVIAEVAAGGVVGAVQGERDTAAPALDGLAAIWADERARMAAAIEEEDRLLAPLETLADAVGQLAREDVLALEVEHLAAHVDDAERGHRAVVDALGHRVQDVAARLRVLPRLEGGRGRAEHAGDPEHRGAHDRDVPTVVHRGFALLEGGLVLLVDHDEPQVRQGSEDGRPRTDDHAGLPERHRHPGVEAFAGGKVAVPNDDLGA